MLEEEYTKFANDVKVVNIATIDDKNQEQPRVRGLLLWFADKTGFYFSTSQFKNVSRQLKKNPNVEMSIISPNMEALKMLRVTGKVRFLNDKELKIRLLEERPFLKSFCTGPEDERLEMFQIYTGEAYFWTMDDEIKQNKIKIVKF